MSANHLTGVDERLEVIVGGTLLTTFADIEDFSVDDDVDEIAYKALGRSGTVRSQDFAGHTGSFTIVDAAPVIESVHQEILAAQVARVPTTVTLVHVMSHKPGGAVQVTHTYTDVKLTFGRQVQRENATRVSVSFATGNLRLVS